MESRVLKDKFASIGARLKINSVPRSQRLFGPRELALDVRSDRKGEFFDLQVTPSQIKDLTVVDAQPRMRHLLLQSGRHASTQPRQKYLCGHDERHWFIAGIPDHAKATMVVDAMESLKPKPVLDEQSRVKLKAGDRLRRRNKAYVRQGEWFFVPRPQLSFPENRVLHHEPISRGGMSKAHFVDQLVREGGESVYVSDVAPQGFTRRQYEKWLAKHAGERIEWTVMQRDARAYVRGRVQHPDHATLKLNFWHEVAMNTENQSSAMRHVVFLD